MENGLQGNYIFSLLQTRDGYLWIGTQNGLVRFDGINFQLYSKESIRQIKDNEIRALYEDSSGTLWIGTSSGGLTRYKDGEFLTYSTAANKSLYKIKAISGDRWGNLWIGSYTAGLTCLNRGKFTSYTTKQGLPHNQVNAIYKDGNGDLWIATADSIVKMLKPGDFREYAARKDLDVFITTCLYKKDKNELWLGTGNNYLYRLKNSEFIRYGVEAGLPYPTITYLFEDRDGNTWIGTDGGGLVRMRDNVFSTFPIGDGLAAGSVSAVYEDREGSLWVGTLDSGLYRLRDSKFTTYTTREGLSHDYIQCIHQDRTGNLWIGTKKGLNRLSWQKKPGETGENISITTITPVLTTGQGLLHDSVVCLYKDPAGILWIGTWGGLHRYKDGVLRKFTKRDGLSDNRINYVSGDREGNTWIGTQEGLNRLSPGSGEFHTYTTKDGLLHNTVLFIFEDSRGHLWIGTDGGLNRLTSGIITASQPVAGLGNYFFRCAYEDDEGTLWFGTDSGLTRLIMPQKEPRLQSYGIESGLIENHVYSILEDKHGNLWIAGRNGISQVSKKELEDFSRGTIKRLHPVWYNEKDGLKSRWCSGVACKSSDGRFWFATSVGVAMIDPNRIIINDLPPPVVIEKFIVDSEMINIKRTDTTAERTLELAPGKKRLELYYTALTFINPQKVKFVLKLEGYDKKWVEQGNLRNTTYTGLPPGHYTFKVKACSSDGVWNETGASLSFYLRPYFYETTWFYFLVVLFILTAVFSLYYIRIRQLKARKEELKRLVDIRTRDLEERNIELEKTRQKLQYSKELIENKNQQLEEQSEKLKELDKAKSRFFANISHDFRTPLTLIQGPLEQILTEDPGEKLEIQAKMMLRNCRRLLNLVDQLLELAKFDSGKIKLSAVLQNIVPFVRNMVMCFESMAQHNKVELTFRSDKETITLYFDPEKLERIIFNLLSNAFNYTPEGGKITVSIRTVQEVQGTASPNGSVEIIVRDTGTGIPADRLPHIFNRFYHGESTHEYKRKGTGIGLALTKELVEVHHGRIKVHSSCTPDHTRGTEFTLQLPRGNAHLKPEDIITAPQGEPGVVPSYKIPVYMDHSKPVRLEAEPAGTGGVEIDYTEYQGAAAREKNIILVVDDNADVRSYIRGALETHFNIIEAVDGQEGIDKALTIIPDLVISDLMMPVVDGLELCTRLKKEIKTSHIPIILLTAKASEKSMAKGLETGADDYITKPFNTGLLAIRVKNLIRLRRLLQQKIQNDLMLQPEQVAVSSIDTEFIKEIQAILEKNLSDPEFNVKQLAKKLYMSPSTLARKVEGLTGESPNRLIRFYRLKRGAQLLKANFGNITEVALAVGFSSPAYFTKCFKEMFNQLPHQYANE